MEKNVCVYIYTHTSMGSQRVRHDTIAGLTLSLLHIYIYESLFCIAEIKTSYFNKFFKT